MKLDFEQIRSIGHIDLLAKQIVEGFMVGLHRSPFHGFSVEFSEHKSYNVGESTRHIDWKVFAKTDKLFNKKFEEETNLRCWLLIDQSSSMYYPIDTNGKISFSIIASACLSYLLQRQKDGVGITFFSDKINFQTTNSAKKSHLYQLYTHLENAWNKKEEQQKTDLAFVLNELVNRITKRSLVVVFTDLLTSSSSVDQIIQGLRHLKHDRHEIIFFHVHDSVSEVELAFDRNNYEFIDIENNEKVELNPHEIKDEYKQQIKNYFYEIKLKMGQLNIDFIELDTQESIDKVLMAYLLKRQKML